MSDAPRPVPDARKILGATAHKRVLIVEGPDDKAVYTEWLKQLAHPDPFSVKVEVVDAGGKGEGGGKNTVLKALEWFRDREGNPDRVFGFVDRDEWDLATAQQKMAQLPQLRVNLERHALENYFCDPDELVPILASIDTTWAQAAAQLGTHILAQLPAYVAHWALLATTDRLKNRLREQGYPGHFATTVPIPGDADIQTRFQQWGTIIDAGAAFQAFDQLRGAAAAAPAAFQCRSHTWAYRFFEKVVLPVPSGLCGLANKKARDWMVDLAEKGQVPADIAALLQPLLV